jgi:hypothetical protein
MTNYAEYIYFQNALLLLSTTDCTLCSFIANKDIFLRSLPHYRYTRLRQVRRYHFLQSGNYSAQRGMCITEVLDIGSFCTLTCDKFYTVIRLRLNS